jgi:hypothetical protein
MPGEQTVVQSSEHIKAPPDVSVKPSTSKIKKAPKSSAKRRKIVIHENKKLPDNAYMVSETVDGLPVVLQEDVQLEDN